MLLIVVFFICFSSVFGKIDWGCKGQSVTVWEDHEASENNPILSLIASGSSSLSSLTLKLEDPSFDDLFQVNIENDKTATVSLTRRLMEANIPGRIRVTMISDKESSICILVPKEVNRYNPYFVNYESRLELKENQLYPDVIYLATANDSDLKRGINTPFDNLTFWIESDAASQKSFQVLAKKNASTEMYDAFLKVVGELDFEQQMQHRLHLFVKDKSEDRPNAQPQKTAQTTILVNVEDVHDQFPLFTKHCGFKKFEEHLSVNSEVAEIKAIDGDIKVGNPIKYFFPENENGLAQKYFQVDSEKGIISIKVSPDRESSDFVDESSIQFTVQAVEYSLSTGLEELTFSRENSTCYFQIEDIDDCLPEFSAEEYDVDVDEHSPNDFPLQFTNQTYVVDRDIGENARFDLRLKNSGKISVGQGVDLFNVSPQTGLNNLTFFIRVKNSESLDYESPDIPDHSLHFQIVATGKNNASHVTMVNVAVRILDINDHFPEFGNSSYAVEVCENAHPGTHVIRVQATDKDSGDFGTTGIHYSFVTKQNNFQIDHKTGEVTVSQNHTLDRETTEEHSLTLAAIDNLGNGLSTSVQLLVTLLDYNDNAPYFLVKNFKTILFENDKTFQGEVQFQGFDRDKPDTNNSIVEFQLLNYTQFFFVDPKSGLVNLNQALDFEKHDEVYPDIFNKSLGTWKRVFWINAQAYDLGIPQLYSEENALLVVDFYDQNDNTPVFLGKELSIIINETFIPGTDMDLNVYAVDADLSPDYKKVFYSLHGKPNLNFQVNRDTGTLSVTTGADLSPEKYNYFPFHLLTVQASDGFNSQLQEEMCVVKVYVLDVNNKPPKFDARQNSQVVIVEEEPMEYVTTFSAKDVDQGFQLVYSLDYNNSRAESPQRIHVTLEEHDYRENFKIDPESGNLTVYRVDREIIKKMTLVVQVEDIKADPGFSPQIDTVHLDITVQDINDNDPTFINNNTEYGYHESVMENWSFKQLLKVQATDPDEYNVITYALEGEDIYLNFTKIDPVSGVISLEAVDYEEHHWVNLTVVATDNDPRGNRSARAMVTIAIEDVNDNKPEFDPDALYKVELEENVHVDTFVININATDKDSGDFGLVNYRLLDNNADNAYFNIDKHTGVVTIKISPDFEVTRELKPSVEAFDNPNSITNSNSNTLVVTVSILDVNDNAPVFNEQEGCFQIPEDQVVGSIFGRVHATDADEPGTNNSIVDYTILIGNGEDYFRVDLETGALSLFKSVINVPIKGRDPTLHVTIMAEDRGQPRLNATRAFCIFVRDINNHKPRFTFPEPGSIHIIAIYEAKEGSPTLNKVLVDVTAEDDDWDENNHKITFSISKITTEGSSSVSRHFLINSESGRITVIHQLKQDEVSAYLIEIRACDSPLATQPLCSSEDALIKVLVKSDKDELPKFGEIQILNFTEHSKAGEEWQIVPRAEYDPNIDDIPDLPICYYIIGGDSKLFNLDRNTGNLTVAIDEGLDREEHSHHWLALRAISGCDQFPPLLTGTIQEQNEAISSRLDMVNVTVRLVDINDQIPTFVNRNFTAGLSSSAKTSNTIILTVLAIDTDEGDNAVFEYLIDGEVTKQGEHLDQIPDTPFSLHNETGEIRVLFSADRLMRGYFSFWIKAIDRASNSDRVLVLVYLLREDQQVVLHIRRPLAAMNPAHILLFASTVGDALGYSCSVDDYKAYSGPRMELRNVSTTFWVHFVNTSTNRILEPKEALKLINQHYVTISDKADKVNFPFISAEESSLSSGVTTEDENKRQREQILYVLAGIAAGLVLALALTAIISRTLNSRLKRQLRAATVMTYDKEEVVKTTGSSAPNTNVHTVQGSNPVYGNDAPREMVFKETDFDNVSLDLNDVDCPDFSPADNPAFVLDQESGLGRNLSSSSCEEREEEEEEDGTVSDASSDCVCKSMDPISNLKRADQKWRQKKEEGQLKKEESKPGNGLWFRADRKKMDHIPAENESEM